jgi:Tol biopolymer transport system component
MTFFRRAAILALIGTIFLVAAGQSAATFPGLNGQIAFVRGGNIFTMEPNGDNPLALTTGKHATDPSISADGQQIVYVRTSVHKPYEIIVMNYDGSSPETITKAFFFNDPAFNPTSTRIVFAKNLKLELIHTDGSKEKTLPDGGCSGVLNPSFSPNGKLIVFDCIHGKKGLVRIETVHPDGSHLRTLTSKSNVNGCPSFAPNGKRVLYITYAKHNSDRTSILSQRLSDGARTKIRTGPGSQLEFDCPEYSPDGSRIVVQGGDFSSPEAGYFFNIYEMDADGSNFVAMTPDGDSSNPDWGPAFDK